MLRWRTVSGWDLDEIASTTVNARYRLVQKKHCGGIFYLFDKTSGKRESLKTKDRDAPEQILEAKNQAERQPAINVQIALAYLAATDSLITTRNRQKVMDEMAKHKKRIHTGTLEISPQLPSIAQGDVLGSMSYRVFFGAGTLPTLLAISFAGIRLTFARTAIAQKLIPLTATSIAILLIVRADPVSLFRNNSHQAACPLCSTRCFTNLGATRAISVERRISPRHSIVA